MRSRHRTGACPRERLQRAGTGALSDAEVIAALMGDGEAAESKAHELMTGYGDLPTLGRADFADLRRKVGTSKACALVAALEVGRRSLLPREHRLAIRTSADVDAYLRPRLVPLTHEVFHVLCLDAKHRLLRDVRVVEGGLASCSVLPREAFTPALREQAVAVIFVHNHPSGDPTPSADDLALTTRLKKAGQILGINPVDHIIIGEKGYVSLDDLGVFEAL